MHFGTETYSSDIRQKFMVIHNSSAGGISCSFTLISNFTDINTLSVLDFIYMYQHVCKTDKGHADVIVLV